MELLEMILLALPLRDMLLAGHVSRTCERLIEESKVLRDIREAPFVSMTLNLPPECSVASPERPVLHADLVLYFDRPVTVRQVTSPVEVPTDFTHRFERGTPRPESPARFRYFGHDLPYRNALALTRTSAWKFVTLMPGTAFRISFDYGVSRGNVGLEHLARFDTGLNNLQVGTSYILAVETGVVLPAYAGTKRSLLKRAARGDSLKSSGFHEPKRKGTVKRGGLGKALRLVGENEVQFQVVA